MEFFYLYSRRILCYMGGEYMAENLVQTWYPSNKLKSYSYVDHLQNDNVDLYDSVKNLLTDAKMNLSNSEKPSIKRLEQLWRYER